MRNDDLAHERNLARKSGQQAVEDGKHWAALADALRRLGATVVVGRRHAQQKTDKVMDVNGVQVDLLVSLRNRPSRANRGNNPSQWEYRFIVGHSQNGGRAEVFPMSESGFEYDRIAERLLWASQDEARRKSERDELRALRTESKPTTS
jgi:hypothetical protein